jgi:predicted glycogen debranching enzyme
MKPVTRIGWRRGDANEALLTREWLVTNGLGGYSSGTISGAPTRRYHGVLVAGLPQPLGRTVMLNQLSEDLIFPDGSHADLGAYERSDRLELPATNYLREFRLEQGLPIWTFEFGGFVVEKRLLFAHLQNTVFIHYRMLQGDGSVRLRLRPAVHFRPHEDAVSTGLDSQYWLNVADERFEITSPSFPPLRLRMLGEGRSFVCEHRRETHIVYRVEAERGYDASGELWSLGHFRVELSREYPASLVASTESWEDVTALSPEEALQFERDRREHLLAIAELEPSDAIGRELVLASDQFVISPRGRVAASTRAHARGEDLRTVIAGYHWFTDWGRDTMISLEGLLLQTGRYQEARYVLHTFAQYVHDGLIPNMFPERSARGVYHTADATLWFFHAIDRYVTYTHDRHLLRELLPVLQDIIAWHVRGTHFGIVVDARDGLLQQGAPGYQLTWMDAKCDGWVVTPRRGKAVEINALWYNALCNLAEWLRDEQQAADAAAIAEHARRAETAFNERFFYADKQYLYDVVDGEDGRDDSALRPNQVFAISLPHAVLKRERWQPVLDAVTHVLLTPAGLRSLSPDHPDYKPNYHGDLRTRDAAYHQGTVWSWLIGPYVDAWLKVYPEDRATARARLQGLVKHLGEAGLGSVSEVFDAEAPFTARGCIAQAWGVAELLRAWRVTADSPGGVVSPEPREDADRKR